MEEKYEIIKAKKENAYQRIKDAEKVLEQIREECDHPEEFHEKCTYSTRPGQYWDNTTICGLCGDVIIVFLETNGKVGPGLTDPSAILYI